MRERDQTHSYWYIPLAPRVNYSLLVMVTAGMMKMASGDDFPLRQSAREASRWDRRRREACGGSVEVLGFFLGFLVFIGIFGVGFTSGKCLRGPQAREVRPGGEGAPPWLVAPSATSWSNSGALWVSFGP